MRGAIRRDEPLSQHTTMRVGGPAAAFAVPETEADLIAAVRWAEERGVPWRVIGLGSNLLCPDEGFDGLVLDLRRACAEVRWDGQRVEAGAGVHLAPLIREAARRGLSGLEGVAGVPGTVGGALAMNAGTAAGDFGAVVRSVRALRPDGTVLTIPGEEMRFGYRRSRLPEEGLVALGAALELRPADREAVERDLAGKAVRRRNTQPIELPNSGSIWQNPPGDYAGRLIEAAGCKGLRRGDAQVSPKHANFIVNLGRAQAADVLGLMAEVRARVEGAFGVRLQPELRWLLGQDDLERRLAAEVEGPDAGSRSRDDRSGERRPGGRGTRREEAEAAARQRQRPATTSRTREYRPPAATEMPREDPLAADGAGAAGRVGREAGSAGHTDTRGGGDERAARPGGMPEGGSGGGSADTGAGALGPASKGASRKRSAGGPP